VADDPLEPLFDAPLDEFVPTRNRIAAELRKDGDAEEADRVKAMRKPSAVVWALNRLARTSPKDVARLIDAAATMRSIQEGRAEGSFFAAQRAFADTTRDLAKDAAGLLAESGKPPGAWIAQRIDKALAAAAASPETCEVLRAGRLTEEPDPIGFSGIEAVVGLPSSKGSAAADRAEERRRRDEEREAARRAEIEAVQRDLREAKAEAARLSRDAERAEARVATLERELARLQRRKR